MITSQILQQEIKQSYMDWK